MKDVASTAVVSPEEVARVVLEEEPQQAVELLFTLADDHNEWHEHSLNLVASHNILSPKTKEALSSGLMENITSGYIGARSHSGGARVDRIESMLIELAKKLYGVPYVEYRAPSGATANGIFMLTATDAGDSVMALSGKYGGHHTYWTNSYAGARGLDVSEIPCYGDDYPIINLELLAQEAEQVKPKWLMLGSATSLFPHPLKEISEIARGVGAKVFYDGAHFLGLAAGGQFQVPMHEGATVMTGSTQKTFGGPVGGLILMNDSEVAERVIGRTSKFISNYQNNRTAGIAVTLAELLAFGKEYAAAVVRNAQALARALDAEGLTVLGKDGGFTQSHIVLVDLTEEGVSEGFKRLEEASISCSPTEFPRTYPHKAGLRLGTSACTKKGMGEEEMKEAARLIRRVLLDREDPAQVGQDARELASGFTKVYYCF